MHHPPTVLITGATAGIGRHAALHLARRGYRVFATGRQQTALDSLQTAAGNLPLETFQLDVTNVASIAAAQSEVDRRTNGYGLDALVNNAGYGQFGPLDQVSGEDLVRQFETNVFGLMAVTRAFLPAMRRRGHGRVVNVGSIAGRFTVPFGGAYHASKHAVKALSDAMRNELRMLGIQVVMIEPGPIQSEFAGRAMQHLAAYREDDSPYAAVLAQADGLHRQMDGMSASPLAVSQAIEKAIAAKHPRARYTVPGAAALFIGFLTLLPIAWQDAILCRAMGVPRQKLVASN